MPKVTIFSYPIEIELVLAGNGADNNNMSINRNDFKIYRGSFNPIDIIIRDTNRKPVNLTGKSLTLTVLDFLTDAVLIQKTLEILDAQQGKARVTFLPTDTENWTVCTYKYTILIENEDATQNLLFTDNCDNVVGFFDFLDGVLPQLTDSIKVLGVDFTPVNAVPPSTEATHFITSAFQGDASLCAVDGLHTVALYATDYVGKFFVQGSLEDTPGPLESEWFDIHLTSFTAYFELGNTPLPTSTFTGIEAFTFTASVRWVRFKHTPDNDNAGTLDQVLYRS